ncbi:MAG: Sapep family Mn(2+)-dependent dipeptidase, partial [Clostridia bacterium]|nr:Sapep family Mn(2+)-dependent dipeptidase [Clostridia bacterium]
MAHPTTHPMDLFFNDTVNAVSKFIRYESTLGPAEENAPFGKGTADCLNAFLGLAEEMGFETHNYGGYAGEVIFGSGEEFAILAHLDVVPAGSGWKYPPFSGVINDDLSSGGVSGEKIWGRGAMDDKGPAVCCLYALYALKQSGFIPKRKIKFILGCNEESGWACIDHYKKVAHMPEEGFTPDANFPAIYAEKGILHVTAFFPIENPPFTAIKGGERVNMVCDGVVATLKKRTANALVNYTTTVAGTSFY